MTYHFYGDWNINWFTLVRHKPTINYVSKAYEFIWLVYAVLTSHLRSMWLQLIFHAAPLPIGSMYAIYGNIYHQYTPNVSIYTIHGSYGLKKTTDVREVVWDFLWHRVWNPARSDGSGRSHPLFVAWLSWATLVEEYPAIFWFETCRTYRCPFFLLTAILSMCDP